MGYLVGIFIFYPLHHDLYWLIYSSSKIAAELSNQLININTSKQKYSFQNAITLFWMLIFLILFFTFVLRYCIKLLPLLLLQRWEWCASKAVGQTSYDSKESNNKKRKRLLNQFTQGWSMNSSAITVFGQTIKLGSS